MRFTKAGRQPVTVFSAFDGAHRGLQAQVDAGLLALVQQHAEDVAGLVVAEQLAEFLLVVGHAVLGDQGDEIPLGEARQRRLAEVRVVRQKVAGLAVQVGEVAAPATGHQDFLAGLVGMVEQQHAAPAGSRGHRAHQPGGAGTDDDNLG